ncbi:MAG TPA: PAS domain-containing protein [Anaerolineae bacterium]
MTRAETQDQMILFETALAHIPLATAILDGATLQIRWANYAFDAFLDETYHGQPVAGVPFDQAVGRVAASGLTEALRKVATTGRASADLRYVYQGPQVGARYWRFSLQPLPGETGELMLHIEDVTGSIAGQKPSRPAGTTIPARPVADQGIHKM